MRGCDTPVRASVVNGCVSAWPHCISLPSRFRQGSNVQVGLVASEEAEGGCLVGVMPTPPPLPASVACLSPRPCHPSPSCFTVAVPHGASPPPPTLSLPIHHRKLWAYSRAGPGTLPPPSIPRVLVCASLCFPLRLCCGGLRECPLNRGMCVGSRRAVAVMAPCAAPDAPTHPHTTRAPWFPRGKARYETKDFPVIAPKC